MKNLTKILYAIGALIGIGFILFLINQVTGLYIILRDYNLLFAQIVTGLITLVLIALVLSPVWLFMKLPKASKKPTNEDQLVTYKSGLVKRLRGNELLSKKQLYVTNENLDEVVVYLNSKADEVIKETATTVFLTTSVSQNGKLDALTVFFTQMRMVWKIAHVYYQRPTLREMFQLYSFVGLNTIIASEIEDLDISQQIEPVVGALFKNASGRSVPFLGPSATLVMDSLLEGSTNAYLTLRVGITAKKYCGHVEVWEPKKIKKQAFKESAQQLKKIVVSGSSKIISGILSATKNAGVDTIKSSWKGIKGTTEKIVETGTRLVKRK